MSSRFLPYFNGLGLPAWLEYGDANFWAWDKQSTVCVEIKRVLDLLTSIERTGRLEQQIRNARLVHRAYYLVLHGFKYIGADEEGMVAQWTRDGWKQVIIPDRVLNGRTEGHPMPYRRMDNYLNTLAYLEGIVIKQTRDEQETANVIVNLYWFWQKPLEEHTSTSRPYQPVYLGGKPPLAWKWANDLEGIGFKRGKAAAAYFGSAFDMANASVEDWEKVEGVGERLAKRVWESIRRRQT